MNGRGEEGSASPRSWWVFDKPLVTDWLFAWAVAISVAATAWPYLFAPAPRPATILNLAYGFLWSLFGTSILLGCGREFVRGLRHGRHEISPERSVDEERSTTRDRPGR